MPPVTEYLASVPVVATHSVEEAREAVSRIYLRHSLSSRGGAMNMRFNATAGGHVTLGYLTYQADAELTMPPTEDCYIVNLTIAGATRGSRGDGVRERTAANERGLVLSPVQSHRVHWSADAEQLHLKVPRARLESHLADLLGRPVTKVIDFTFGVDLTSGPGRGLLQSVCFLAAELDRPAGLAEMPLSHARSSSPMCSVPSSMPVAINSALTSWTPTTFDAWGASRRSSSTSKPTRTAISRPKSWPVPQGSASARCMRRFTSTSASRRWRTFVASDLAAFAPNCFAATRPRCE